MKQQVGAIFAGNPNVSGTTLDEVYIITNADGESQETEIATKGSINLSYLQETTGDFTNLLQMVGDADENTVIVLKRNAVYEQDNTLLMKNGITIEGKGATLKRSAQSATTTTSSVSIGGNSVNVSSVPSGWKAGDFLQLYSNDTNVGSSYKEEIIIASIVGNTINFKNPITLDSQGQVSFTWNSGTNIRKVFAQIRPPKTMDNDLFTEATDFVIRNLIIDGNMAQNAGSFYWGVNMAINNNGHSVIEGCTFKNIPNENVYGSGFTVRNNYATNLNGSFVHTSGNIQQGEAIFGGEIANNITYDTNKKSSDNVTGHSEGVITFSFSSGRTHIHDNRFIKSGESALGNISGAVASPYDGANRNLSVHDNYFEECKKVVNLWLDNVAWVRHVDNVEISNNVFSNCGSDNWSVYNSAISEMGTVHFIYNILSNGTVILNIQEKLYVVGTSENSLKWNGLTYNGGVGAADRIMAYDGSSWGNILFSDFMGLFHVADNAGTPYTKASINSTYPNAKIGYTVICDNHNTTYIKKDNSPTGNWSTFPTVELT